MKMPAHARLFLLLAGLLAATLAGCQKEATEAGGKDAGRQGNKPKAAEAAKVEIPGPQLINDSSIMGRLQLRDPNQLVDRVASWVDLVQPAVTSETLRQQLAALGLPLQDLAKGQSVSAFALAPAGPNESPGMAVMVPAAASSPLVQGLSRQAPDSTVTTAGSFTMIGRGLPAGAAAPTGQKLLPLAQAQPATDIQLYLNTPALMSKFGAQLSASVQALPGLAAMAMANQPGGAARMNQILPVLQAETTALLDFLNQSQYLSLGADLGSKMFELSAIAKGQPGTTLDKVLQAKPVSAPDLGRYLDSDSVMRVQQSIHDLKGFLDIYLKYVDIAMGQGKQAEMAKLREELKDAEKVGKVTTAMAFTMKPEGKAIYELVTVSGDNDAYMNLVRTKFVTLLNSGIVHDFYANMGIEMSAKEDPQTRKVAGAEVHRYTLSLKGGPALPPEERAKLEKMFGEMSFEIAQVGDYVVGTLGEPIDALAGRVAAGQGGESIQAMKTYPAGGVLYADFNVAALMRLAKSSVPQAEAGRIPSFAPGAPPIMAAGYHTEGLAWYRLGIPKALLGSLKTSQGTTGAQ